MSDHGYGSGQGIDSEELIKELLQQSGWAVKELRKASDPNRAPLLKTASSGSCVLVDFQVHSTASKTRYVEVKSKTEPIEYGIKDELRHGYEAINHSHYEDFAANYTDDPVYVFIHETKSGVVLRQRLRDMSIAQRVTNEDKLEAWGADGPMAMFRRESFDVVTDDVGQYSTAFGQSGLVKEDIDLDAFGDQPADQAGLRDFGTDQGGQTGLSGFGGADE
jgi:hypothetical protein